MAMTTIFCKNFQLTIALRGKGSWPRVKMSRRFRRENSQGAENRENSFRSHSFCSKRLNVESAFKEEFAFWARWKIVSFELQFWIPFGLWTVEVLRQTQRGLFLLQEILFFRKNQHLLPCKPQHGVGIYATGFNFGRKLQMTEDYLEERKWPPYCQGNARPTCFGARQEEKNVNKSSKSAICFYSKHTVILLCEKNTLEE